MEIIKTIFNMSITGSIIFLLIKPLTKKNFNSSWHYKMLILILIFFIVPVGSFIKLPVKSISNISSVEIQEFSDLDNITVNEDIKDTPEVQNMEEQKYEDKTKREGFTKAETENYNPNKNNFNIDSYEKITNQINSNYTSYNWIDDETIVYVTKRPGFTIINISTKDKVEHIDEYYYDNFKATNRDIIYSRKTSKWTTEQGDFATNDGIVEIDLNEYDSKDKKFATNIIIEGRKSTDKMIGYDPVIWDVTEDGKYIYIMEQPASASLSTDGVAIGIYDVDKNTHTKFTDITSLPYKNHLSINPKDNNLIGLIEGGTTGFYGHIGTEKAMDIFLSKGELDLKNKENNNNKDNVSGNQDIVKFKEIEIIFNKDNLYFDNIKDVKLLKIEKLDDKNANPDVLRYMSTVDYKYKKAITHEDGMKTACYPI